MEDKKNTIKGNTFLAAQYEDGWRLYYKGFEGKGNLGYIIGDKFHPCKNTDMTTVELYDLISIIKRIKKHKNP